MQKKNHKLSIEKKFLLLTIPLGLIFMAAIPPGAAPDEVNHFRRAYEISEGNITSSKNSDGVGGRELPNSINGFIYREDTSYSNLYDDDISASGTEFQVFANTSLYSPLCYFPQVIGILIGRFLQLPMVAIFFLARIVNFIVWTLIMYYVLKFVPFSKKAIFLIVLTPISLQAAISCQADGLTNACAFGLITFVLYKLFQKKTLNKKEYIIMSALAILVSMLKIVYIPLVFLLCLIPKECFKSKKDKIIGITLLIVAVIIMNAIWLTISSGYLVEFNAGVNSKAQVMYIITHPFIFIRNIASTIMALGESWYINMFGGSLSYFSVNLSPFIVLLYSLYTFYVALREKNEHILNINQKILFSIIALTVVGLIFTSLYVQWTPVREPQINGIQGRYFIPLLPILLAIIVKKKASDVSERVLFLVPFLMNIYAIYSIIRVFIG